MRKSSENKSNGKEREGKDYLDKEVQVAIEGTLEQDHMKSCSRGMESRRVHYFFYFR